MKKLVAMAMGAIMAIGFAGTVMLNPEPVCADEFDVIVLGEEFSDEDATCMDDCTVESDGITYRTNGGAFEYEDGVFYITNDDCDFECWNTESDGSGTTYYAGDVIGAGEAEDIDTLYADWDDEDTYVDEEEEDMDEEVVYATEDDMDKETEDVADNEAGDIAIDNDTTVIGGDSDSNNSYDSHDVVTSDSNNNSNNNYYADNSYKTNNTSYNTTNKIFNDNRIFKKHEDPKGPSNDEVITTADNYVDEPYTDGKYNEVKTGDHNFIFLIGAIAVAMMAAIGGIVALATGGKKKSQNHNM